MSKEISEQRHEGPLESDTSSIGPKWPPKESSFNRIKGVDTRGVITDSSRLEETLAVLEELKQRCEEDGRIDRASIRILIENNLLLGSVDELQGFGEAIIPLSGGQTELKDVSILYLGFNCAERQPNPHELQQSIINVHGALQRDTASFAAIRHRAFEQGYQLGVLKYEKRNNNGQIQKEMALLYERFGWSFGDVLSILSKKNNILAVAYLDGQIVSAGIAETAHLAFGDGVQLRMAEITEAATDERHQGKGLYTAVAAELMLELYNQSTQKQFFGGEIDLVFGECNGNAPGVLKAVRSLGRSFSYEHSLSMGVQETIAGYLPQHVPIAGPARSTPYNDLFPAYINRQNLVRFIEKAK